ncbi:hypothetical protein HG537_0B04150 [Torulaspora globosa]|uniref:protein kinase C n=1 Tax=Torulaspora globosa TaxID=48254 RepID=A0A7H9HQX6_9SACH|nr:hypothetical protein HG537_0B04150 [Torulaspora sp. CBS 2947]
MYSQVEQDIQKKIERESNIIQGATNLKKRTQNVMVIQKCNTSIREARQNIEYLEETLKKLRLSSSGNTVNQTEDVEQGRGSKGYRHLSTISPEEHSFSRLDLIKYDCPSLSQKIQYMLQQLEFKLQVERQYQEANAKLTKLYQIDGDRQSSSAAEGGAVESKNRIQLLTKALKKYQAINVDLDPFKQHDVDSLNHQPKFRRKQLTGELTIGVNVVRDVDHIESPMFSRKPESYVTIKIDDTVKARTRASRNDRWNEEFQIHVGKGNEVEITIYDKVNDAMIPVAVMWLLLSDIAEEIRKKKAGQTSDQNGWVNARVISTYSAASDSNSNSAANIPIVDASAKTPATIQSNGEENTSSAAYPSRITTNSWFTLEPAGQILLTLGFNKSSQPQRKNLMGGLHRHGAIISRQEEIYEQHGHHFVQKSFYNIMCCAYCGEFLRYTGFQCQDCKFLCHKKCYNNVVTKCIAKTSTDSDPDEAKLNHRIPHRFEPVSNRGTKWCCHCGYILPWVRQKVRKCSECAIMCHAQCAHLVPDFCGMSMEMANRILKTIQDTKRTQEKKKRISPSIHVDSSASTAVSRNTSPIKSDERSSPQSKEAYTVTIKGQPAEEFDQHIKSIQTKPLPLPSTQVDDKLNSFIDQNEAYLNFTQKGGLEYEPRSLDPSISNKSEVADLLDEKSDEAYNSRTTWESWKANERLIHNDSYNTQEELDVEMEENLPLTEVRKIEVERIDQEKEDTKASEEITANLLPKISTEPEVHHHVNPFREMNDEMFKREQAAVESAAETNSLQKVETHVSKNSIQSSPSKAHTAVKHRRKAPKRRKVSLDDFILLKVLGKGNFGKVLLSKSKNTDRLCAIKVLKKDHIIQNHDIESARAEKKVFLLATKAKHPFLTNLFCSFQTENRIYFAMEFIGGGDLMWHVQNQRLSVRRAKFYAAEVLLALKYFHSNGVIYRDLKLENILLTPEGHIKIADYGLCKDEMWYGSKTSTFCGTPEFMAPEILKEQAYTKAVDWWAFGVLLYQMLLCQSPFSGDDEDEVFNAILTDEPLYPIDMAGDIVQIFQGLLTKDPEKRLGAGPRDALDVMEEPFFRNINFDDILNLRVQPPYVPDIKSPEDTSYFEQEFTSTAPTLTPMPSVLDARQQEEFRGFSFMPDDLVL